MTEQVHFRYAPLSSSSPDDGHYRVAATSDAASIIREWKKGSQSQDPAIKSPTLTFTPFSLDPSNDTSEANDFGVRLSQAEQHSQALLRSGFRNDTHFITTIFSDGRSHAVLAQGDSKEMERLVGEMMSGCTEGIVGVQGSRASPGSDKAMQFLFTNLDEVGRRTHRTKVKVHPLGSQMQSIQAYEVDANRSITGLQDMARGCDGQLLVHRTHLTDYLKNQMLDSLSASWHIDPEAWKASGHQVDEGDMLQVETWKIPRGIDPLTSTVTLMSVSEVQSQVQDLIKSARNQWQGGDEPLMMRIKSVPRKV